MISLNNLQRILIKFGLWFGTGILICLVGISGVFADTYKATQFTVEGYDNYGPTLSRVTTDWTNNSWRWTIPSMIANSAGSAFIFNSPIPLISNHTYTLTAQIENSWGTCLALSSFNRIGLGITINNSKSSYENNTNVNENYSNSTSCNTIQFAFTPTVNGTWLTVPFSTTSNTNIVTFTIYDLVIDDLGSKSLTQDEINNSLTNQTNILNANINAIGQDTSTIINQNNQINNNINAVGQDTSTIINQNNNLLDVENQNKQEIINNQNANNEALIDNNNKNTQDLIDDNKKNFQTCRESYNLFSGQLSQFENINGSGSNPYGYFTLPKQDTKYTLTVIAKEDYTVPSNTYLGFTGAGANSSGGYQFVISPNKKFTKGQKLTISNNDYNYLSIYRPTGTTLQTIVDHFDVQLQEGEFTDFEPYGEEICINKLDEQNKQLNDLNNSLNDDDSSGATSEASDFFSSFNTNTFGLTSIITAPLNLIQSLTSSTCSELHLPLPYLENKYLDLPCMTTIYQTHFGTFFTMYQTITYGIIAYWVCVRIFNQVKDFKNPEHDEIEVVDL